MVSTWHLDAQPDLFKSFARMTGGFNLVRVEQSSEDSLTVIMAERGSETIARETVTVTTDATGHVTKTEMDMRGMRREGEFALLRLDQAAALKALDAKAREGEKNDTFSGVYLIARDNRILAHGTFGYEDREAKRPITMQTKFRIGSVNKIFTAVAALQLVAAGKLSLDGTVGKYLSDYPNRDIADKVTIRMLLAHTGGTGDFFGPEYDKNRLAMKTHADYVALFGARAPRFTPDSKDAYSNYDFLLLGRIIERASGEDYYDYVAKHVFAPAGMKDTGSLPEDVAVPHRAAAYTWKDGWSRADDLPYRGTSAGGGYTTAGDLLKFGKALRSEKLLPGRLLADATVQHDHSGGTGYGFSIGRSGMLQHYGHNGGSQGQNAVFSVYPALGVTVIVLSNFDPNAADNLTSFYVNRMPQTR
jgi:D-alanyl-D-alanine carboxypeptidase